MIITIESHHQNFTVLDGFKIAMRMDRNIEWEKSHVRSAASIKSYCKISLTHS